MNWRPDPGHLALLQEIIRSRVAAGDTDQQIRDRLVLRSPAYRAELERMRADGASDEAIRSILDWWWQVEFVGNTTVPQYLETARLLAPPSPTTIDGLTLEAIRRTLDGWTGDDWPPTQDALADEMQVTGRRIRQVLRDAGTTWKVLLGEAARRR
jgi:hypothetical protein